MEARLADMERSVRRWRAATLMALGLGLCALVIAAWPHLQGELRAPGFALVNDRGEVVARLGFDDQGEPQLGFKLLKNKGTVLIGALAEDIGGVGVIGKDARIMIATDATGSPSLSVSSGQRSAVLGVQRESEPTLLMIDGKTNLSATTSGVRVRQASGNVVVFPQPEASRAGPPGKSSKP